MTSAVRDRVAAYGALGIDLVPLYHDLGLVSTPYFNALEAVRAATRTFMAIRDAYRAREIDDATFLAAQDAHRKAEAAFDVAYAKETA